ncbi:hypothetical protein NX801_22225 [Streptomyces sp. LP05-1]|uniref:Transferase n=1 Tax=Streptomyces pyxinae TaxID=2970734 RepID=A0ABT2CLM4_9ACTN|nr:hypothetical protein [Streptomyces sp. LP05-1]MCS0638320.1 hypothetical protein [Streptomyces sp. LP05-1]
MSGIEPAGGTPRVDCLADAAGAIVFTVPATDVAAADAAAGTDPADTDRAGSAPAPVLELRRRGRSAPGAPADGDERDGTVRLPLSAAGADGRARAELPLSVPLAEGHWDVYLGGRGVAAGFRDLRALLDRVPPAGADGVAARVPCPAADGRLAVRVWHRFPHAEAGDLAFGPAGCTVEGALYGAPLGPGAVAEARAGDRVYRTAAEGRDGTFRFTLDYRELAAPPVTEERMYALWLRPAADAEPVRISRVLDDVWDRRGSFAYPARRGEGYRAVPCYTNGNDLCVRVTG